MQGIRIVAGREHRHVDTVHHPMHGVRTSGTCGGARAGADRASSRPSTIRSVRSPSSAPPETITIRCAACVPPRRR